MTAAEPILHPAQDGQRNCAARESSAKLPTDSKTKTCCENIAEREARHCLGGETVASEE